VIVRPAQASDVPALVPMYEWLFAPPGSQPSAWDPERAAAALKEAIAADAATVLIAELEGRPAGFCTAYADLRSVRFGPRVWVEDLAVDPRSRSLGVGKQLLDQAKHWAREHGATHLELDSSESRAEAHRFYEREGPSWRSISYGWEL
jgi:GNAT superfamily N-acetyltransferase